jgi:tRNA A37 N6-isopentenylltransferase MiaA
VAGFNLTFSQLAYAKSQIEWAKKNKETWEEAKAEVDKIDETY